MPKIPIVDDDVTITKLMKALVNMDGNEPTTVNDSLKAVDVAQSVPPDLIALDLMMPGVTGFELCALLHKNPKFASLPIVIVRTRMMRKASKKPSRRGQWLISLSHLAWTTS